MANHIFTIAKKLGLIGSGKTEAHYVTLPGIAKTNAVVDCCVANEFIAGRLGQFIGLPLAPGAIVTMSKSPRVLAYATLRFRDGVVLPDADPVEVVNKMPELAAGCVVFDILIANPDRHTGNISGFFLKNPPELFIFDHSHALLGYDRSIGLDRLKNLRDRLGISGGSVTNENRHCLLDELEEWSAFKAWTERVRALPDFVINDACQEMLDKGLVTHMEQAELAGFLRHRRDRIQDLLYEHRFEFKKIKQFPLSPTW